MHLKDNLDGFSVPDFINLNVKATDTSNLTNITSVQLYVSFLVMSWTQTNKRIYLWWRRSLDLFLATRGVNVSRSNHVKQRFNCLWSYIGDHKYFR